MTAQTPATLKAYFNTGDVPTEAQFTNLIDSMDLVYNVKAYGAVGDGVTDDTTAIQAALDAAAAAAAGGMVYLPAGTYAITTTLSLASNLAFVGAGRGVTTITYTGTTGATSPNLIAFAHGNTSNVYIGHFTLNGGGTTGDALSSNGGIVLYAGGTDHTITNITIDDVEVHHVNMYGIWLYKGDRVVVRGCYSHNNLTEGIANNSTNVAISDCYVYDNDYEGIGCYAGSENVQITNCHAVGCTYGFLVAEDTAKEVTVSNCRSSGATYAGFSVNGGSYVTLSNCIAEDTGSGSHPGFYIYPYAVGPVNSYHIDLVNCQAIGNHGTGFLVSNGCSYITMTNCRAIGNTGDGFFIDSPYVQLKNVQAFNNGSDAVNYHGVRMYTNATSCLIDGVLAGNTSGVVQEVGVRLASGSSGIVRNCQGTGGNSAYFNPEQVAGSWKTDSRGGAAATVADGGTIAHGLMLAPTRATVCASVAGEFATVTTLDATNITVAIKKHDNSAGTTQTIYWEAEV